VHIWRPVETPVAMVQLQHGFAEYSERFVSEYHGLIPKLLAAGYEVWATDLQGHGESPGRRAVTDTVAAVRDHVAVRQRMRERELPVLAFGHSYGGLITAASVAEDDRDVRGVVLTSPVLLSRTPWAVRRVAGGLARLLPARAVPGRANVVPASHDPAVVARSAADARMFHGTTTFRVGATALEAGDRLWRGLDRWTVPLVIFHGTADGATNPARSAAFVEAIADPSAEFRSIDGGYHELLHDHAEDDEVSAEIIRLFSSWVDRAIR
jgi:acylglycerol lipase